jgi:hypothetical protein
MNTFQRAQLEQILAQLKMEQNSGEEYNTASRYSELATKAAAGGETDLHNILKSMSDEEYSHAACIASMIDAIEGTLSREDEFNIGDRVIHDHMYPGTILDRTTAFGNQGPPWSYYVEFDDQSLGRGWFLGEVLSKV